MPKTPDVIAEKTAALPPSKHSLMLLTPDRPVHFVGVGGIGMSGLASILKEAGFAVSGSDATQNAYMKHLATLGVEVFEGHNEAQVPENAVVVLSTAITPDNPEVIRARELGLPMVHRSDLLREILQGAAFGHACTIGLTGTHGKTTTTGMTALVLLAGGLDPTVVAGGKVPSLGSNARLGVARRYAVAELDESDGTLTQYQPDISVITNLELDHADYFSGGLSAVIRLFEEYLAALKPGSTVVFHRDCPRTFALYQHCRSDLKPVLFSLEAPSAQAFKESDATPSYYYREIQPNADQPGCYRAQACRYVAGTETVLGQVSLQVPGRFNLLNALCAIAIGDQVGVAFPAIASALAAFTGMGRRFERLGQWHGASFIDDYAHHPTEVAVTLEAAKAVVGSSGRVMAIFQPHRFTRLKSLWDEFLDAFTAADKLFVLDVYPASEPPIEGIDTAHFCEALQKRHPSLDVTYIAGRPLPPVCEALQAHIQPSDVVISLGAGDITYLLRDWPDTRAEGRP